MDWRPLDRNSLVAKVLMEGPEWMRLSEIRDVIHAKYRVLWDELPSHREWKPQKIALNDQNVRSRLRHLERKRRVVEFRFTDDDDGYHHLEFTLLTPARVQKRQQESLLRLRIPEWLEQELHARAEECGVEVQTSVRPNKDKTFVATCRLTVITQRGIAIHGYDCGWQIDDDEGIFDVWTDLMIDGGIMSPMRREEIKPAEWKVEEVDIPF